jgi:hypothetical protein
MLIMQPRLSRRAGVAAWHTLRAPKKFVSKMVFASSKETSSTEPRIENPALLMIVYCGTVLRHPAALIQAAKGSSPMFVLAIESCAALT